MSYVTFNFLLPVIIFCCGIWYFQTKDDIKQQYRTCVIGAGYGGLATARYLKQHGVDFTVLEAQRTFGGIWRYRSADEENGLPPFTGVYKNLRTNTPRPTMEFADFPFPDTTPSYPHEYCFYKYLRKFTKEFDLEKYIQFKSLVTSVKWAFNQWKIDYKKTDTKERYSVTCDFVVVAIGHYNQPKIPIFKGQEIFEGQIIHVQKYKDPEKYRNRRVLLIGAGPSGLDLAIHLTNVTSRLVHSHHLHYRQPKFGLNYVKKPDVEMFLKNGVVFKDGCYEEVDDVILCTGYEFNLSFLDKSCELNATTRHVVPVYQHMAEYAVALIAGKFQLPSLADMMQSWLKHVTALYAEGRKIDDANLLFDDMVKHKHVVTGEVFEEDYEYVIVGTGHHSKPHRPVIPGEDLFNGTIIHSHDYRVPDPYINRKVLVMGGGPSGMEIGLLVADVASRLVHSHHSPAPFEAHFPPHYVKKADVKEFKENGVVFVDGSFEEVDDVIYCTAMLTKALIKLMLNIMAPLVLEGATLGKRHQNYNNLLKNATSSNKFQADKIDYEKTDVENLFNIDIASNNKDVADK
ncbi:hypothetical protein MSG28_006975 [Choristoneura fumiferana]|uniref:Uncharacterized protein n=1 Tax=Choristoneura fumiferana TaxID=7141 RepID=A0ACC0JM19_CHOFU|nr:hypothetical protein MSG28_006975 [Choristoneura fumiferana]